MKFYECKNFEFLARTRKGRYQENDAMVFAFNNIPGFNLAHCYISAPRGMDFFNLGLYQKLKIHTNGVHDLLSAKESRALSRLLKKHSGWRYDQFGTGLYGNEQVHFFAQPSMIERIAMYFLEQERLLGDLAFNGRWNDVDTRVRRIIGSVKNDSVEALISLIEELESTDNWRNIIEYSDWPFLQLWVQGFLAPNRIVQEKNILGLKIAGILKWTCFYYYLKRRLCLAHKKKDDLAVEFLERKKAIATELENIYPFFNWEFPLEPKVC